MSRRRAITLVEVMAVLIIVSIVMVVAVPNYQRAIEAARDKEAIACLRLIQAGERVYRSKVNDYYPVLAGSEHVINAVGDINQALNLSLNEQTWDYTINYIPLTPRCRIIAQRRISGTVVRWWYTETDRECNTSFGAFCCAPSASDCPAGSTQHPGCPEINCSW